MGKNGNAFLGQLMSWFKAEIIKIKIRGQRTNDMATIGHLILMAHN